MCGVWPQLFDVDDDNSITRDEFASLLRSTLGVCDLDVTNLFNEIDIDGSDHITYGECTVYIVQKFAPSLTFFIFRSVFLNSVISLCSKWETSSLHLQFVKS